MAPIFTSAQMVERASLKIEVSVSLSPEGLSRLSLAGLESQML